MMLKRSLLIGLFALCMIGALALIAAIPVSVSAQDAAPTPTIPPPTLPPPPTCPAFADQSATARVSYYMGEGVAFQNAGQLGDAELSYTCIIRNIDSRYLPAYMARASVYMRLREYEAAFRDYNAVLQIDPNQIDAYNNRGVVFAALADRARAADDFDRALALDSTYAPAINNRAIMHALAQEYDAAIALIQAAIEASGIDGVLASYRDPEREEDAVFPFAPLDARLYALLGIIYERQALDQFQNYLFLYNRAGLFTDDRIASAAGALESRFTFELRLDDNSWLLTVNTLLPERATR
jgi:tetratricopeptide (TPR) repeat protein